METYDTIEVSVESRVGIITLNRPNVMNAINDQMINDVNNAMKIFNSNQKIACIVINGNGRCFSAGFDMKEASQRSIKGEDEWRKVLKKDFDFTMQFWDSKKPTIAAVHGFCLAGAFEVMLACDISISGKDTFFGEPEVRFGSGIIAMLAPWVTGPKQAKEILLTGNDRLTAEHCYKMGVLNHVVDEGQVRQKSLEIANQISKASDQSVQSTKRAINKSYEISKMNEALKEALEIEIKIESEESPEREMFNKIRKESGLKAALEWRDSKFN